MTYNTDSISLDKHLSQTEIHNFGLHLIDNILHDSGHALSDFPTMPQSQHNWSTTIHNRLILQQMNYDSNRKASAALQLTSSLNNDQQHVFQRIWQSITHNEGKSFFIDGYGGCGKTYLYQAICHAMRAEGIIILCVGHGRKNRSICSAIQKQLAQIHTTVIGHENAHARMSAFLAIISAIFYKIIAT